MPRIIDLSMAIGRGARDARRAAPERRDPDRVPLEHRCALAAPRTFLCCLPLKVPDADGAPARVVALEDR